MIFFRSDIDVYNISDMKYHDHNNSDMITEINE